ncbi:hypothetical protein I553_6613 [Mycobacterium xenopi 4042]|uniref:Uncharacterized protein n=1 Tax=Mycobacterium xenopi 4042 TaxID=1299334 RepID=X8BHP9_MYCXE|nr:hypothetical protein I553_6613 [Mycobacterium xenopi 4042]
MTDQPNWTHRRFHVSFHPENENSLRLGHRSRRQTTRQELNYT